MAVTLREVNTSRPLTSDFVQSTGQREYVARVTGESEPENAAGVAAEAAAPFYWFGLHRQRTAVTPLGGDLYRVVLDYGFNETGLAAQDGNMPDPTQTPGAGTGPGGGSPSTTPSGPPDENAAITTNVNVEIGGRPPKVFSSQETVFSESRGGTAAPDQHGAINVQPDGKVEGVDIPDPPSIITLDFTADYVTWKYIKALAGLVWKTNDDTFYSFEEDQLVFLGASLRTAEDGRVAVTLRFGLDAGVTLEADSITTGLPYTTDRTVPGFHYYWVLYETQYDAASKRSTEIPAALYIERLLKQTDFAALGVGT
jgi:hypothetical protein